MSRSWLVILLTLSLVPALHAEVAWHDDFDDVAAWEVVPSDGVVASVHVEPGLKGNALRLDVNFEAGSGFCVIRRKVDITLPENYRFRFDLRGELPPNNLEFKLVDPSMENVWWVNKRAFEYPAEWTAINHRKRHFSFAWGPSGGKPHERLGAIEFAIAASSGGKGSIWLDNLTFETLPVSQPASQPPAVETSSQKEGDSAPPAALGADGRFRWTARAGDAAPSIRIDFGQPREFGGLSIDWQEGAAARDYDVYLSPEGKTWELAATVRDSNGGRDYVVLPDAEASQVRIDVKAAAGAAVGTEAIVIRPVEFGASRNRLFAAVARESKRGFFPRYCSDVQQFWTVVGAPADDKEALIDGDGAVEVDKGAFRIEPFVFTEGKLRNWSHAMLHHTLHRGYVPIPSTHWQLEGLRLSVTAIADGEPGASTLHVHYKLVNIARNATSGTLFLAIRPFQVLPPWHELNMTGGVTAVRQISGDTSEVIVDGARAVRSWSPADGFGAATFAQGDIVEYLSDGKLPAAQQIDDPMKLASAALRFDYELKGDESLDVVLSIPFHGLGERPKAALPRGEVAARLDALHRAVDQQWVERLNVVQLTLPPMASAIANTFRTMQGYIMINADGPRIQPGSRTYERSWIRDGSLEATALLYTGHPQQARAFLEWYAPFQYPSGKVPCVVDKRGPDPVPEHDSTGQLIYALWKYYRMTGDRSLLEANLDRVVRGIDYIESLRAERMTPEYRDGLPEARAMYGLVTESISHEGYSAKPMHSYWDNFFVVRGLKDAVAIAHELDKPELEQRFAKLLEDYRKCLYASIDLAMKNRKVDYIPGCVELGDFDATSTAIALFPCGEQHMLPQQALQNTFDRYFKFFEDRAAGRIEWRDYTPYEVRIIGAFVRLGQPARANALIDFFIQDQQPTGWNQWGEISYRDKTFPGFVGDMPHTWVGADFLSAVRSLFVYEREQDESLVLLAGVRPEWLQTEPYVEIKGFPTEYGTLSYAARIEGGELVLTLAGDLRAPNGGLVISNPLDKPIRGLTVTGNAADTFDERSARVSVTRGEIRIRYEN